MEKKTLKINTQKEKEKINCFIKSILKKQGFNKAVIGLSGGLDSTTCLYLLSENIPLKNIIIAHLYYYTPSSNINQLLKKLPIPRQNQYILSIKNIVSQLANTLNFKTHSNDKIRLGNIIARIRMIILYDIAKKNKAIVCGTENKSEHYLGYFTRFGDEASDFEPIKHLFKTQVKQLALSIKIPKEIIIQAPSAGLWPGQTDEKEFGFSYQEADPVLYLYYEKKYSLKEIRKKGYKNPSLIINWAKKNRFKHTTPYSLTKS